MTAEEKQSFCQRLKDSTNGELVYLYNEERAEGFRADRLSLLSAELIYRDIHPHPVTARAEIQGG